MNNKELAQTLAREALRGFFESDKGFTSMSAAECQRATKRVFDYLNTLFPLDKSPIVSDYKAGYDQGLFRQELLVKQYQRYVEELKTELEEARRQLAVLKTKPIPQERAIQVWSDIKDRIATYRGKRTDNENTNR